MLLMCQCWSFESSLCKKPKKQAVFLPIYKFLCFRKVFCHSSYLLSFFETWVVSSLVPTNPTRRFRFCRSIAKILRCNPLNSTSFVVGIFQSLPASLQFSTRSGQVSHRFPQIWPDLIQICQGQNVHYPDLEQIWADLENREKSTRVILTPRNFSLLPSKKGLRFARTSQLRLLCLPYKESLLTKKSPNTVTKRGLTSSVSKYLRPTATIISSKKTIGCDFQKPLKCLQSLARHTNQKVL